MEICSRESEKTPFIKRARHALKLEFNLKNQIKQQCMQNLSFVQRRLKNVNFLSKKI